jgi:hypothetical protein
MAWRQHAYRTLPATARLPCAWRAIEIDSGRCTLGLAWVSRCSACLISSPGGRRDSFPDACDRPPQVHRAIAGIDVVPKFI